MSSTILTFDFRATPWQASPAIHRRRQGLVPLLIRQHRQQDCWALDWVATVAPGWSLFSCELNSRILGDTCDGHRLFGAQCPRGAHIIVAPMLFHDVESIRIPLT